MASTFIVDKYVILRLTPFFVSVILYFYMRIPSDQPSVLAAVLKCLPILCLNVFIILTNLTTSTEFKFKAYIFLGLLFSCAGDGLLVWDNLDGMFLYGMVAFAIGHIFYILPFGVRPWQPIIGLILAAPAIAMGVILVPRLTGVLKYGVPVYIIILLLMSWRAIVWAIFFKGPMTLSRLTTAVGAVSWVVSDAVLGYSTFHSSLPYSQIIIMTTYYFGQMGITLSILNLPQNKGSSPAKVRTGKRQGWSREKME